MPPTHYPTNVTQGDVYCVANADCGPDLPLPLGEVPAVLDCQIVFGEATPYGRRLKIASRNVSSGWDVRRTEGDLVLDDGAPTPYGRVLRPFVPIGCKASVGTIRQGDFDESIVLADRTNFARLAKCEAVPGEATPYGRQIVWRGYEDCDNLLTTDPSLPPPLTYRQDVFYTQLFGTTCAYCPTLFLSADAPCVNCSYPTGFDPCGQGHVANYQDGCQGSQSVGGPTCIPPEADPDNFRIACDIDFPLSFGPNHCEECVHHRNLGFLVSTILNGTDCLSKIPMRPSLDEACAYGCGEFGWELWTTNPAGLRIPDVFSDQIRIAIIEGPCTFPGIPPCFNNLQSPGLWESGHLFCTFGANCLCLGQFFCVGTHIYEWDRDNDANRLVSAKLCFSQSELCEPGTGNGPCDANPVQDPDDYSNPSSRIIVDVTVRVVIKLVFKHWGPRGFSGGGHDCACCALFDPSFEAEPDEIVVTLTGEFCGPIAWGNQEPWTGFRANEVDRVYPGIQGANGSQIVPPLAAHVKGACGNLIVDQGQYKDPAAVDPGYEPPKRCTTWLGNFEGPPTSIKFWRTPWLRWTWKFTQFPTDSNWRGALDQPNQHQQKNECWAAQPIVNDNTGCQEGKIFNGPTFEPCHDPGCRRGCSMHDDTHPDFLDPCASPKATPWGCGQGQTVYPP